MSQDIVDTPPDRLQRRMEKKIARTVVTRLPMFVDRTAAV